MKRIKIVRVLATYICHDPFAYKNIKGKKSKELARTVIHLLSPFKEHVKSISSDNGTEFACYEMIEISLGVTSIL